eukprot:5415324-Pyramimonas_sp.AAC.1
MYHIHVRAHVPGPRDIHLSVARSGLEIIPELVARFGHQPARAPRGHAARSRHAPRAAPASHGAAGSGAQGGRQRQSQSYQGDDDLGGQAWSGSRVSSTSGASGIGLGGARLPAGERHGAGRLGGGPRLRPAGGGGREGGSRAAVGASTHIHLPGDHEQGRGTG